MESKDGYFVRCGVIGPGNGTDFSMPTTSGDSRFADTHLFRPDYRVLVEVERYGTQGDNRFADTHTFQPDYGIMVEVE
jgi:hypothetical protein